MIDPMTIGDFIAYQPGELGVHAFYTKLEAAQEAADVLTNERGKLFVAGHFDDWWKAKQQGYLDAGPLHAITEEEFDYALGVLPPIYPARGMGFIMCEYLTGTISTQYAEHRGRFYCKTIDTADRSTWITPEAIEALLATA